MKSEKDIPVVGGIKFSKEIANSITREGKQLYNELMTSGMAWEFHPWLTGDWNEDKERYIKEVYANTKN